MPNTHWRAPAPKPPTVKRPGPGALNNITFKKNSPFVANPMPAFPAPPGWNPKQGGKTRRLGRNKRKATRKHSGGWW